MLLAYRIHMGIKDVWKVGINGEGYAYGTIFHKNIAQVFFDAASDPSKFLHRKISQAIPKGRESLEGVIRENIFMPFLSRESQNYTSGQILSMAKGITVWTRAMSEFFALIPSLLRDPEKNMRTVFIPPEQKLQACYDSDGIKLNVAGCYDALLFNPDKCDARLFEFKGYMKSDISVPLSQSLIYSWLIWKHTGIIPSVEIIYLGDDDKEPAVFSPSSVREMIIAGLPGLFRSAFGVISLKGVPEISRDEKLCSRCPFDGKCANDWRSLKMKKRRGASLLNVVVFMMFAVMVTAQVFFFSKSSSDSVAEEREIMLYRLSLDSIVEDAKDALKVKNKLLMNIEHPEEISHDGRLNNPDNKFTFDKFYDGIGSGNDKIFTQVRQRGNNNKVWEFISGDYHASIHDLDYIFFGGDTFDRATWTNKDNGYGNENAHKKLFAAISPDIKFIIGDVLSSDNVTMISGDVPVPTHRYYLIRAWVTLPANYYGRRLMYQVLVKRYEDEDFRINDDFHSIETLSFQEVWY